MARDYDVPDEYIVVANAAKQITKKYQINNDSLRNKLYRSILELAKAGRFDGKKYKNGRIWMIKHDVIPHIEEEFNLKTDNNKTGISQESSITVKKLIKSFVENGIDEKQAFNILKDVFLDPDE